MQSSTLYLLNGEVELQSTGGIQTLKELSLRIKDMIKMICK